jgi:hypothetical protein
LGLGAQNSTNLNLLHLRLNSREKNEKTIDLGIGIIAILLPVAFGAL